MSGIQAPIYAGYTGFARSVHHVGECAIEIIEGDNLRDRLTWYSAYRPGTTRLMEYLVDPSSSDSTQPLAIRSVGSTGSLTHVATSANFIRTHEAIFFKRYKLVVAKTASGTGSPTSYLVPRDTPLDNIKRTMGQNRARTPSPSNRRSRSPPRAA